MIEHDTIVAPATPPGVGGLAVVRLSGPQSGDILKALDSQHRPPKHRQATFLRLEDSTGLIFDDAMATFFRSPNSYTGEDMAEISCHGNPLIVQQLVSSCCTRGARIADPGEFTKRAFVLGKMDLIQAEAVASFIEAQSLESTRLHHRLLRGDLSTRLVALKTKLMSLLQSVEYALDISEEEIEPGFLPGLLKDTTSLDRSTSNLLATYQRGHLLTFGATVVLTGPPNSGKSTLLNRLSNSERAITSPDPGTTRDFIDVQFTLEGIPVTLIDTAGLRESRDSIEEAGITRTRTLMKDADILVWIQSATDKSPEELSLPKKPDIVLLNKSDLLDSSMKNTDPNVLFISALYGDGMEAFKSKLLKNLGGAPLLSSGVALTTARQHAALISFQRPIRQSLTILHSPNPSLELISFEFRDALESLDVLLGKTTPDDIIRAIFSNFCVGK
ncbi:MAG: tRNA uridine-5-carboxymethylaminomethyl(34) synthesis GTPase MnmE [FCB group bacterium]|nr:tRNA uridine-5-carboxymethylaminomethyl(34) synthesis GTPase MnmE [FCB group bacterium]